MADKICEKCIHYEMCKSEMDLAPDDTFSFFPYNEDCPHFKNKSDFVEVVRCKDCIFYEPHGNGKVGICRHSKLKSYLKHNIDFCSYGQRKLKNDFKE